MSVLCWGYGAALDAARLHQGIAMCPHLFHHGIKLWLPHIHLAHLFTSFDKLLWLLLSSPLQKKPNKTSERLAPTGPRALQ